MCSTILPIVFFEILKVMISGMLAIIISEMLATIIARSVRNYSFQICWQLQTPEILTKILSEMSKIYFSKNWRQMFAIIFVGNCDKC